MTDRVTLAHGIGGPEDLPIPLPLTIAGGVAALVVSFTVLALAWRTPRYAWPGRPGRPVPAALGRVLDSPVLPVAGRVFGLLLFGYTAWVAVLGPDLLTNPVFGMFYVLLWVGLVPASLLLGPVWRALSPMRTIHRGLARLSGTDPEAGIRDYPAWLGHWPAAVGLFAFVWMELVYPEGSELGPVRLWLAVYVAAMLVGGAVFGQRFYELADPFEVFSTLVGHLSVWGRAPVGSAVGSAAGSVSVSGSVPWVWRSPLDHLARVPARPGLVAVVAVLFGSTAYDSFHSSSRWVQFVQASDRPLLAANLALLGFCAGVGLLLTAGCTATGVGADLERRELPRRFAHSVVPIIVGYFVAHYLSYLVITGQQTIILMSDPMGEGSNLLGTADWQVDDWLLFHPRLLAVVKVLGVVLGHVVAVVAAHDRAVSLLPRRHQLTGQLPLLMVMVTFTVGGLWLLFAA